MWTGVALSILLCQAKADFPAIQLKELSEQRFRQVVKTPFGPQGSLLTFHSTIQGPVVKEAVGGFHLKLERATDDQKRDLISPRASDKPWDAMAQFNPSFDDKDAMRFSCTVRAAARGAATVSVKGTIELRTGMPTTVEFIKAKSLEGTVLKHAELDALKLKISVLKPDKDDAAAVFRLETQGDERLLLNARLLDAKKQEMFSSKSWVGGVRNGSKEPLGLVIRVNDGIPADAKLELTLLKAMKVVTVPFEFKDVELP